MALLRPLLRKSQRQQLRQRQALQARNPDPVFRPAARSAPWLPASSTEDRVRQNGNDEQPLVAHHTNLQTSTAWRFLSDENQIIARPLPRLGLDSAIALGLLSVVVFFKGLGLFFYTSGEVQGSEFGMLITLVQQSSLFMLWAALFAAWRLAPEPKQLNTGSAT